MKQDATLTGVNFLIKRPNVSKIEYFGRMICVKMDDLQSLDLSEDVMLIGFYNDSKIEIYQDLDKDADRSALETTFLDFMQTWKNYEDAKPSESTQYLMG